MREIQRKEGVQALYRGLRPSLIGILPEAGIAYGSFDILKQFFAAKLGVEELGVVPSLSCGIIAAVTGQAVAYPLEAISRNMALGGGKANPPGMDQVAKYVHITLSSPLPLLWIWNRQQVDKTTTDEQRAFQALRTRWLLQRPSSGHHQDHSHGHPLVRDV